MTCDAAAIEASLIADWAVLPVSIGESGCRVLRLECDAGHAVGYLKHGSGLLSDQVMDEMARLRWLHGLIPVPEVIRYVATPQDSWLLTKPLEGQSARSLLNSNPALNDAIIDSLADFLTAIHALPVDDCPFHTALPRKLREARMRMERGQVNINDFDDDYLGWSAEQAWRALETYLPLDSDPVVTHGDYALDNVIMASPTIVGCLDVGAAGVADRYQDLAICWADLASYGAEAQERFLARYGVGRGDQRKLAAYRLLNEFF